MILILFSRSIFFLDVLKQNDLKFPMSIFNLAYLSHYVRSFLLDMKSLPSPHENIVVGLSGGRDSVLLLKVMAYFKRKQWIKGLSAVHVDYLTWGEKRGILREGLVQLCREENVDLKIFERKLDEQSSNFEMKAREIRFKEFATFINGKTWIVLGHHINDSLEWSLMQQMKSSSPRAMLGIPLKRGRYLRPFMCLTRNHISSFCLFNRIPYRDDPSAENCRFERNWIRKTIFSPLKKVYPKIEKHYVLRHNRLALQYGLHSKSPGKTLKNNVLFVKKLYDGIVMIDKSKQHFLGHDEAVITAVKSLSQEWRGKLGKEIAKIPMALKNAKQGPLVLSGKVHIYLASHRILLVKQHSDWFQKIDRTFTKALDKPSSFLSLKTIVNKQVSYNNLFTQYIVLRPSSLKALHTTYKKEAHPNFKHFNAVVKERGLVIVDRLKLLRLCEKNPTVSQMTSEYFYS